VSGFRSAFAKRDRLKSRANLVAFLSPIALICDSDVIVLRSQARKARCVTHCQEGWTRQMFSTLRPSLNGFTSSPRQSVSILPVFPIGADSWAGRLWGNSKGRKKGGGQKNIVGRSDYFFCLHLAAPSLQKTIRTRKRCSALIRLANKWGGPLFAAPSPPVSLAPGFRPESRTDSSPVSGGEDVASAGQARMAESDGFLGSIPWSPSSLSSYRAAGRSGCAMSCLRVGSENSDHSLFQRSFVTSKNVG